MPMNECADISCSDNRLSAGTLQRLLNARLTGEFNDDQLVEAIHANYTNNEFIEAACMQLHANPESTPSLMALVNRLNRRGIMPAELVGLLESKISGGERRNISDSATVDLGRNKTRNPCAAESVRSGLETGRVLRERYVIEQRLGNGGKGTVFKALDRYRGTLPAEHRHVAIKILHDSPGGARDETIAALRQELQSAQMLSHPNIVKVYDFDRDGDVDFLTMEFLDGELLSSLLHRFQPVPLSRPHAWSIIRQMASGLAHAHERNIVHADLKPENIMITNSGEVRILDFGASRAFATQTREFTGRVASSVTPAYACCELLDGRNPDPRDDLYALACISYELLTGAHPFQRRRASEARAFGVVPTRPSGLSRRQWHTLAKGLSWHRGGRSISVGDWFKALKPGPDPTRRLASLADLKPAPPIVSRSRSRFGASAVFGLLVTFVAIWMLFVRISPEATVRGAALPSARANAQRENAADSSVVASATNGSSSLPGFPLDSAPPFHPEGQATLDLKSASALTRNHGFTILPGDYQVQPGQHFAEIRVHRPANVHGDAPLVWWTEAASAKPGVDYVSQAKVTQSFPKGKDSMSFFVKLLPKASRSQGEVFYIAVADKGDKHEGQITHTAVHLPSSRTTS
jgi:serine/threonine protein kinase